MDIIKYEDFVKANKPATESTIKWNGMKIRVKRCLDMGGMVEFVESTYRSCFGNDTDGNTVFRPESKDFAIRSNILELYTNIELPEDMEERYVMLYSSDIVETVMMKININQLQAMIDAAEEKIADRNDQDRAAIKQKFNDLETKVNEACDYIMSVFNGVSPDDLTSLVSSMSNGKLDEEKLVRAFATVMKESGEDIPNVRVVPR